MILAVDPGTTTGWALYRGTQLKQAGRGKHEDVCYHCLTLEGVTALIVEAPRVYPYKGKGDLNGLIDLALKAGEIWGSTNCAIKQYVHPATWKGSVPKDIHHRRVLAVLSVEEIALLPKTPRSKKYDHNMLDAVGLGLWHLGRLR